MRVAAARVFGYKLRLMPRPIRRLVPRAANAALAVASVLVGMALIEAAIAWLQPITTAYRWDAVTGYRLRPNLSFTFATAEFTTRIATNSHGLREPEPTPGDVRPVVLVLGDSFAFGHGVDQEQSFPALLQQRLGGRARVVNSGHPGWGTVQEAAWFDAEGRGLAPKVVVIGFVLNDVLANSGEFRFSPTATGWLRHLPFPAIGTTLEYLLDDPRFVLFRLGFNVAYGATDHTLCLVPDGCAKGWAATAQVLARLAADIRAQGAVPVLAHLPTRPETGGAEPQRQAGHGAGQLAAIAGQADMRFVTVGGLDAAAFYPRDGHWTAAGHRVAADTLLPLLADLLEPSPP